MALDQNALNRIMGAARARNVSQVEELWVDLLHMGEIPENLKSLIKVVDEVARRGDKDRAADLLVHPLMRTALKEAGKDDELFEILRKAVALSRRVKGIRHELLEQYRRKYSDREGLEAVISKTDLGGEGPLDEAVRQLDEAFFFQVGDYVFHERGWGIGRVVEAHPETGELVIDFCENKGQRMDAGMALKALEHRPDDDLEVLIWTDSERLIAMAKDEPLKLLRNALTSLGGKTQSKVIRDRLTPVLGKSAWTKFWGKARKLAKDDPQIEIGSGARANISLRDEPLSREEEVAQQIRRLRSFTDRLVIARRELIAQKGNDEVPAWLEEALRHLGTRHGKVGTPGQRAAALELALFKDEVAEHFPSALEDVKPFVEGAEPETDPDTGEPLPVELPEHLAQPLKSFLESPELSPILKAMCTPEYRKRVVRMLALQTGDEAVENLKEIVLDPAPQTWEEAVKALKSLGREDAIIDCVNQVLISPRNHPLALAAFSRGRFSGSLEMLPDRTDSEIMIKVLKVYDSVNLAFKNTSSRKEKARLKPSVEALRTTISEKNQKALKKVIDDATEGDVRRVLQIVRQSPTLTGTIIRSAEKSVAKRYPEMLATVATNVRDSEEDEDTNIYTTAEGVRKREAELKEILDVRMPQITIEIGKALEFGDISENAELDAARETQQRLADTASRIQEELSRVVLIDPAQVDPSTVVVGSRVTILGKDEKEETYTLLGPWDLSDEDSSIISYMSAMGKGLLGSKEGEEATITLPSGKKKVYKVQSIERAGLQSQN